ncbi:hypothetical protein [Spirochaeta isovalerica]|uniref:Uncharacterized protein n=1 Tax=Spirochaeta isovalerica TaxID=150 RepID=A0A841RFU5_9SPIO|nr:hypothetical protein [Spirochaeta isovalerica]MBB6481428.1 hypothetical protein [Spirochaeta isovalerica]
MLKLFKRKKNNQSSEEAPVPPEKRITGILNKLLNLNEETEIIDTAEMRKRLDDSVPWLYFHLCGSSDIFDFSIVLKDDGFQKEQISHLLNEALALEVLPGILTVEDKEPLFWNIGEKEVIAGGKNSYYIVKSDQESGQEKDSKCLIVKRSREFAFGSYLIPELTIGNSPICADYSQICFDPVPVSAEGCSLYRCTFTIDNRDTECFYSFKGQNPSIATLSAQLMKAQKNSLGRLMNKEVKIRSAGPFSGDIDAMADGYELEGNIYSPGGSLTYAFRFPRKLINLLPEQECSTVKGKILQTNRELFSRNFSSFHLTEGRFLLDDLLTLAGKRDINLICQNFFLARSLSGNELRELFYHKIRKGDRIGMTSIPFRSRQNLLSHLPVRLRDGFIAGSGCSDSLEELLERNRKLLEELYNQIMDNKILLGSNTLMILERETGARLQESKMLRLKKLMSNMGSYNALMRMDSKTIQIFLGQLNHTVLSDLFVYQPKNIVQVKPFLSRTRFNELMEDVRFTQKRIKTNQIDINRICDNIERFNRESAEFIEKENEKIRRNSGNRES